MRSIDLLLFEYSSPFFAVIGADDGLLVFIFFLSVVFIRSSRCSVRYLFVRAAAPKRKKSAVKNSSIPINVSLFSVPFYVVGLRKGKEKENGLR
jgi:hypothetical protein